MKSKRVTIGNENVGLESLRVLLAINLGYSVISTVAHIVVLEQCHDVRECEISNIPQSNFLSMIL